MVAQLLRGVGEPLGVGDHQPLVPDSTEHLADQHRGARIILDQQHPERTARAPLTHDIGNPPWSYLANRVCQG